MKFDLKKFLKAYKLNEENISMVLGAVVIVIVGLLVVNYFKGKGNTSVPAITTENTAKIHTVTKGETLWSIAEDELGSGYNWTDIYNTNDLKTDTIEIGQKLTIPQVTAKEPTVTKQVSLENPQAITGSAYTVVHGDDLWNISVRAYGDGYKWVEIAKANDLTNPNIIHSGNVLILPR